MKSFTRITRGVQRPALWAWTVSIVVHVVLLGAFGLVRFSRAEARDGNGPAPTARIERIRELMQTAPVMPKPKTSEAPAVIARNRYARVGEKSLPLDQIFRPAQPILEGWRAAADSGEGFLPAGGELPGGVEFFGSLGRQRKICYLVDCSGSMQGIFTQVREKLKESIAGLQPDQYFYVIFFGGEKLYELGGGELVRATPTAKAAANALIDAVRPAGKTNAIAALERVVRIRDGRGAGVSLVYFLTDGFELTDEDAAAFPQRIASLLDQYAPGMRINTIGFLPQADDRKMLEAVARQSGGESVCVGCDR